MIPELEKLLFDNSSGWIILDKNLIHPIITTKHDKKNQLYYVKTYYSVDFSNINKKDLIEIDISSFNLKTNFLIIKIEK